MARRAWTTFTVVQCAGVGIDEISDCVTCCAPKWLESFDTTWQKRRGEAMSETEQNGIWHTSYIIYLCTYRYIYIYKDNKVGNPQ